MEIKMKDFDNNKVDQILFGIDANHSNRLELFFKKKAVREYYLY